jgi:vacuolar-type H+-ATPase subunit H
MDSNLQDTMTGGQEIMRIFHVLDKIENAIHNGRNIPLSNYIMVNKDKIIKLIDQTRLELPKEMKQARWVSQENQRILQEAQKKAGETIRESEKRAEELIKAAQEESRKRLDKEQIVVQAKSRAEEIMNDTQKEAERMMMEAQARASEMMRLTENQATDLLRKAKEEAKMTRNGADEYALKILTNLENEFTRVLSAIQKSRKMLQETSGLQGQGQGTETDQKLMERKERYDTREIPGAAERLQRGYDPNKFGAGKTGLSRK